MTPVITYHAHERATQRFGWHGTREALADHLVALRGMRVGLAMGMPGEWFLRVPQLRMRLVMEGPIVKTIIRENEDVPEA